MTGMWWGETTKINSLSSSPLKKKKKKKRFNNIDCQKEWICFTLAKGRQEKSNSYHNSLRNNDKPYPMQTWLYSCTVSHSAIRC